MEDEGHAGRVEAAARWYAELSAPEAGAATWEAFRAWEREPANAAAFREVEDALRTLDRTSLWSTPSSPARPRKLAGLWAGAIAAAVFLSLLGGVALLTRSGTTVPASVVYVTKVGEQRLVELEDGSSVFLNTSSRIEVAYSDAERRVRLVQGQALFDVEKGEAPFVVQANTSQTRALGTTFEVYARPDGSSVTLLEGAVSVAPGGTAAAVRLAPGERLVITDGGALPVETVDLSTVLSWRSGVIQFRDTPLADAVAELNRYSVTKIVLGGPGLAGERFSGAFRAGDQDMFVAAVALYLPVTAERSGDTITLVPTEN